MIITAVLGSRDAGAEPPPPTRLEYRAPATCPSSQEFARRVNLRSARIRLVSTLDTSRLLSIEVDVLLAGFRGTLRLVGRDGTERLRTLQTATCDEAVDGLALIAAVALDPEAAVEPIPEPPPPPPRPPPRNDGPSRAFRGSLDLGGGAALGVAPGPLLQASISGQLSWEVATSVWAPALRLTGTRSAARNFAQTDGVATFTLTRLGLELCPLRFDLRVATFRPCLLGMAGNLEAKGSNTVDQETHTLRRWEGGGAISLTFPIGKFVEIRGHGALTAPLRRDNYQFAPNVFFSTPGIAAQVGIGAGVGFP